MLSHPADIYNLDTRLVAQILLGCFIVRVESDGSHTGGRIVETEAYLADDPASHSYRGETPRNRSMFGAPGYWYVYRSYGIHHCLNLVTAPEGVGEAVLIRSIEPLWGLPRMETRRRLRDTVTTRTKRRYDLSNGPGKLAEALAIDIDDDGTPAMSPGASLVLLLDTPPHVVGDSLGRHPFRWDIIATPRIGISRATDKLYRFTILDNRWVGRPRLSSGRHPFGEVASGIQSGDLPRTSSTRRSRSSIDR